MSYTGCVERIGQYQIVAEVGRGAMGVVFRGVDPLIGRPVAVKIIQLQEFSDSRERAFLRQRLFAEARAAGSLSHPGIVTIYQVGEEGEQAFVAMEFVDGATLEDLLDRDAAPRQGGLVDALRQAAEALDYAHSQGVVHRDIKPANIMIRADGVVKITDFGVAKFFAAKKSTQSGLVLGTPHYMSPEQIQGEPMNGRADQFSLAVIAYEALAGVRPFAADTLTTLFYRILHKDPAPLLEYNAELSPGVAAVLNRALAKAAADRFESCAAFVGALREACEATSGWNASGAGRTRIKRLSTVAMSAYEPEFAPEVLVSQAAPIDLAGPRETPPAPLPLPAPPRPEAPPATHPLVYILGTLVVVLAGLLAYTTISRREATVRPGSAELQRPAELEPAPRRPPPPAAVVPPAVVPAPSQPRRETAPPPAASPTTPAKPAPATAPKVAPPRTETPKPVPNRWTARTELPAPLAQVERPPSKGETPPRAEAALPAPNPLAVRPEPPAPAPKVERPISPLGTPPRGETPPPVANPAAARPQPSAAAPKVERPISPLGTPPRAETPPPVANPAAAPKVEAPPPSPAPAEPAKTKPAPAGPTAGRVFWTGPLAKGQTVTIDIHSPALSLSGRFPRAAVRIRRVWPGELSDKGAKVYVPDAALHGVNEAPSGRNGGRATRYVFDADYVGAVRVIETPTAQNQWRLILRSENRRLSAVAIDWELLP